MRFVLIVTFLLGSSVNLANGCSQFYDDVCAVWMDGQRVNAEAHAEPFWNRYTETTQSIADVLQAILTNDSITSLASERRFYQSCVRPADYTKQLRVLIIHLGGVTYSLSAKTRYNYVSHILEVSKLLRTHPILKWHFGSDRMLHIGRGDLIFPELFLTQPMRYKTELSIYAKWIEKSLNLLEPMHKPENLIDILLRSRHRMLNAESLAREIVEFEILLAKLPSGKFVTAESTREMDMLQKLLDGRQDHTEKVKVDAVYVNALENLLRKTHWRVVSNYIVWSAIKELSRHTSNDFRRLSFEVDKALLGISVDLSRDRECIDLLVQHLDNRKLINGFLATTGQDAKRMVNEVRSMAAHIIAVYKSQLNNNTWLSPGAKQHVIQQIQTLKFEILQPSHTSQDNKIQFEDNHLVNVILLKQLQSQREFASVSNNDLQNVANNTPIQWPSSAFDVNAYYSPAQNAIILPLGILQPPFFHLAQPPSLNYGGLGVLIGHELSHALDGLRPLDNFTYDDFVSLQRRRACINEQFSSFDIDHALTLSENIADFMGIRLSYSALHEILAPDAWWQEDAEMFFQSYAKMWCEVDRSGNKSLLAQDEHAPVSVRVQATLENFPSFRETFRCVDERLIDERSECILW